MAKALQGKPSLHLPQPPNIVAVLIDPKTGLKARPNQNDAVIEYFLENKAPKVMAPLREESQEDLEEDDIAEDDDEEHLF